MYTLRYIFRLIYAFFSRFRVLILVGIGVGIVIFFLANFLVPVIDIPEPERIGLTGRYTASTMPDKILRLIGNGLTKMDSEGQVEPDLAKSWETPDKGKTWIFTLDDTKLWQDGKKITSADINYQFSDVVVEKPDEKTVVFKLQTPYSAFASVVSKPVFKKGLLGTGEYKVKKIDLVGGNIQSINLINKEKQQKVYKFYPSEDRTKMAFKLGEVDVIQNIVNLSPFDSWQGIYTEDEFNTGEYEIIFLNTKNPKFGDKTLRQALSYAIDKDALGQNRALGPISKKSWAYNSQVKPYTYDPIKAKKIIDDMPTAAKEGLSINLSTSSVLLEKAEKVAGFWNEIGVKTDVSVYSNVPENYDALYVIFDIPEDPDQYSIWHSTQDRTNISNFQNPRIDKLLEDGRIEINNEERKKIYLDFQRYLVEEAPAIFLNYPQTFTVKRRNF